MAERDGQAEYGADARDDHRRLLGSGGVSCIVFWGLGLALPEPVRSLLPAGSSWLSLGRSARPRGLSPRSGRMPPPARRWERCRSSGRPRPSRQRTTTTDSFFLRASWMDVLDSSYWGDIYWWAGFVPRHGEYDQLSFEPPKLDLALHTQAKRCRANLRSCAPCRPSAFPCRRSKPPRHPLSPPSSHTGTLRTSSAQRDR